MTSPYQTGAATIAGWFHKRDSGIADALRKPDVTTDKYISLINRPSMPRSKRRIGARSIPSDFASVTFAMAATEFAAHHRW
jgi:hypothetical protein